MTIDNGHRVVYFRWLRNKLMTKETAEAYSKLLNTLFNTPFTPMMDMDENRYADGIDMRYQFANEFDIPMAEVAYYLDDRPCSIFEMMAALAIRCEDIMTDWEHDRTGVWFFDMLNSLGLVMMTNDRFSADEVKRILTTFNNKEYKCNGSGGLYTVPDYNGDIRELEIWDQMHLYLAGKD